LTVQQWGLKNTAQNAYSDTVGVASTGLNGTDVNAEPVYSTYGYTGYGVTVAVVDSGLEIAHEDLSANVVSGGSWNFATGTTDPTNTVATTGDHGTMVAGLIAMAKNGIGGMGVAPNAQLKGFNLLAPNASYIATYADEIAALGGSTASPNSSDVAIFNQSFGSNSTTVAQVNAALDAQYASGVSTLRGGKGALYVKSAGNGYVSFGTAVCTAANALNVSCQNANFDPDNTLPYNIVVAALNAKGLSSSYSTAGSAIWASTPGGEYGLNSAAYTAAGFVAPTTGSVAFDPAMVTTDQSGCAKGESVSTTPTSTGPFSFFNWGGTNLGGINRGCNYTNGMNGTSSAAPMMSGVIALILEANPALTWREVKDILAKTAVQVDATRAATTVTTGMTGASVGTPFVAEQGWITNAAGRKFHNWYGFGVANASAAVAMAKTYPSGSLGTFTNTGWISSGVLSLAIPDYSTAGVSTALAVPAFGVSSIVETVQIKVTTTSLLSGANGDIGIELTSPLGTKSILKNIQDGLTGTNLPGMVLASNAFYGEVGTGNWTVKVIDGATPGTQTLTNVQIRVYGH
jgi:subtilisin family serine protease